MKAFLLYALLLASGLSAQPGYHPRDTSYSIHSSYEKISRTHPEVKPVYSRLPAGVIADTNVVYAKPGRPLHLDVYRQPNDTLRPGILMIHGGGWTTGSKENLVPMAQRLAAHGYVTVVPEYRLSAEAPYPAAVEDLKRAVRWMRDRSAELGLDTNQIAAYGSSAGAHLASLLGTTNHLALYEGDRQPGSPSAAVQAVVNVDGIVSFVHPAAEPEWTGRSATAWLGAYADDNPNWREASPLEYAGKHTPPFLFVNSSQPRFHAGRDDLCAVLDHYGTYHASHTFADTPHAFWLLDPWFEPTLDYTLDFLRRVFGRQGVRSDR